jgi:uncharacterized coiled-coil protein SlyX
VPLHGILVPCLLWAFASAAPVWSAELIQVRVGSHPTFTRVVFEFDVATGYRIERRADGEAEDVIVVTLDAAARPRNIVSRSPGVASVSVEEGFDRAVARISTRKAGLPIKEMILRNPPRVVLDLMLGESAPVAVAVEPIPVPAVAEPEPVSEPAPAPAVAEPEPVSEPTPAPAVAEPEFATAEPESEPEVVAEPVAPPDSVVDEFAEEEGLGEPVRVAGEERASEAAPDFPGSPDGRVDRRRVVEMPPAAQAESRKVPFDTTTAGAIAGGVLALILVAFFAVRRRRALPNDMDVTALAAESEAQDEAGDDGRIPKDGFSMDGPAIGQASSAEDFEIGVSEPTSDENKPIDSIATGPAAAPGLFDEALQEKEAETMENQDLPITRIDSEAPTHLGVGAGLVGTGEDSGIASIVQELESRIAHLETRLDESVDARERLERQVAAQSEELRVQRAAIARTQRALRSLNRSEEDQATEPALREPPKPAGPQ